MYFMCMCDGQIGSARVTPEDEKTTRKEGNMKFNEKKQEENTERRSVKITRRKGGGRR